jgi:hypothetical protein
MFLFRLFQSFLPLHNPIGFGASDFIELALASMLLLLVLARTHIETWGLRLAKRTGWCMLALGALPIALRLALLPYHPLPTPRICDEFSYLLLADTLAHFRLANPMHPMHAFFEALFVQQEPRYASIYPLGQGIVLALGRVLFGHPWAGVALSVGALCALCYWMLRAWTTPGWALTGGLLAVFTFGPLNLWMNGYWGGAASAVAGCLVFGALPRLREYGRPRDAVWLGLGLGLQLLTRPFEFLFLVASALVFGRKSPRLAAVAALAFLPAAGLMLLQNKAVTGNWTTLPYVLSREQYGVPTTLTFQANPVPHHPLNQEQRIDYELQSDIHGRETDTPVRFVRRLADRVRFYRFFFLAPLYIALAAFLLRLREARFVRVLLCLLIFSLGANFYPYFYPHYIAAASCLFVLLAVAGLERLGAKTGRAIVLLCAAQFLFWYGLHLVGNEQLWKYEPWDSLDHGDPDGRIAIDRRLSREPGKQLVFVRYGQKHLLEEWVHNAADIDGARVVWANDLGDEEDAKLSEYYPDRKVWLLEPDATPPKISAFQYTTPRGTM